jgi:hypothetical protein
MRDFNPVYVGSGSFTSDQDSPDFACMSAVPPIATKLVRRNEVTLCAMRRLMHPYSIPLKCGRGRSPPFTRLLLPAQKYRAGYQN